MRAEYVGRPVKRLEDPKLVTGADPNVNDTIHRRGHTLLADDHVRHVDNTRTLEVALTRARSDDLRRQQAAARAHGRVVGIGRARTW